MSFQVVKLIDAISLTFTGGINHRGDYSPSTSYLAGDAVLYNGSSYVAIQNTNGNAPTSTTYWQLLAAKGDDGGAAAQGDPGPQGQPGPAGEQGPQGPAGADGESLDLAAQYARELSACPRRAYDIYGDSSDGGTTPDSSTQASIDALIADGVPEINIVWYYVQVGQAVIIIVPHVQMAATITVPTLTGVQVGSITMPNASYAPAITVPSLLSSGQGGMIVFPAGLYPVTIAVPTLLATSSGLISLPNCSYAPTITVPVLGVTGGSDSFDVTDCESGANGWSTGVVAGTPEAFDFAATAQHHGGSKSFIIAGGLSDPTYYDGYISKTLTLRNTGSHNMTFWTFGTDSAFKVTVGGTIVADWTAVGLAGVWHEQTVSITQTGSQEVRIYSQYGTSEAVIIDDISIPIE